MSDDFGSAVSRHYYDAELLLTGRRFDNAAYLAGYAVECGLKALILHGGGQPKKYGHDLPTMASKALALAVLLSPAMRRYYIDVMDVMLRACKGWKPELRYSKTGDISHAKAKEFIQAARISFERLLIPMILDGRVEIPR